MRISLVIFTANVFGGGNKFAADLASALQDSGHEVAICAWDRPEPKRSHEEFFSIPPDRWFVPGWRFNFGKLYRITFNLASTLGRCVESFKPDIVINTTAEPSVLRLVPSPIKKISFVHYPTELTAYGHSLRHEIYRSLYWWIHYKTIKELDAVVCNSNYIKEITYIMWKCSLPDKGRYHAIYPCVDVKRFAGDEGKRERKVCCVGRIDKNKGIDMVVDAFLKAKGTVPEAKLEIVGGVKGSPWAEAYYPSLVSRLKQIGDERIGLTIDVPSSEIVKALLTSRCMANFNPEEHFGIVPVEAMAAGTPPIVADGGGQRETVIHGETGYLVHSMEEMAGAMEALLSDDGAFVRMSRAGRDRAAQYFSKEVFARRWNELFAAIT
jgi:glycosyltransferase involved in cell wall biosynthesis